MISVFKALLTDILATILRPRLLKLFHSRPLTILMYHGVVDRPMILPDPCMVQVSEFRSQMRYLKQHFKVISLTKAVELLERDAITEPTVVITFDDGYQNNHDLAFPILREENLPATIFLSTLFTDTKLTIWTGTLQNAFASSHKTQLKWRDQLFDLSTLEEKKRSLRAVKSQLKNDPQQDLITEIQTIVANLSEETSISLDSESPYRMLNSASIENLANSCLIEFGGHTHSHYILSRLPRSVQDVEIRKSIELVESFTGTRCRSFAYPNGKKCDYNEGSLSILKEIGVKVAMTTELGTCDSDTPLLELKRISVSAETGMSSFKLSLFNIPGRINAFIS